MAKGANEEFSMAAGAREEPHEQTNMSQNQQGKDKYSPMTDRAKEEFSLIFNGAFWTTNADNGGERIMAGRTFHFY